MGPGGRNLEQPDRQASLGLLPSHQQGPGPLRQWTAKASKSGNGNTGNSSSFSSTGNTGTTGTEQPARHTYPGQAGHTGPTSASESAGDPKPLAGTAAGIRLPMLTAGMITLLALGLAILAAPARTHTHTDPKAKH
nr:hypothetical protein [Bifidobacterium aemilianum]